MRKEIIVNSSGTQNRVAIVEDGVLVDFFVDLLDRRRMVGNIYHGKIARVLPGIRAAFVDIGMKHDAFLHFSDIGESTDELRGIIDEEYDHEEDSDSESSARQSKKSDSHHKQQNPLPKLKKGEDIIVQIIKEPVENKGVRVSTQISIPGRFCVLLPMDNKIGISKKISHFKERKRLKRIARSIIPEKFGLIVRTAAKNQSEEVLAADLRYLMQTWEDIEEKLKSSKPPELIFKDVATTLSVIRDLFTPDVSKVFVDSRKVYKEIRNYVKFMQKNLVDKVELFKGNQPIFEAFK
ncbi:MAG: S1 RNA-binding domain-containing protein, partial [Ignavibacteria bacterium]